MYSCTVVQYKLSHPFLSLSLSLAHAHTHAHTSFLRYEHGLSLELRFPVCLSSSAPFFGFASVAPEVVHDGFQEQHGERVLSCSVRLREGRCGTWGREGNFDSLLVCSSSPPLFLGVPFFPLDKRKELGARKERCGKE